MLLRTFVVSCSFLVPDFSVIPEEPFVWYEEPLVFEPVKILLNHSIVCSTGVSDAYSTEFVLATCGMPAACVNR